MGSGIGLWRRGLRAWKALRAWVVVGFLAEWGKPREIGDGVGMMYVRFGTLVFGMGLGN